MIRRSFSCDCIFLPPSRSRGYRKARKVVFVIRLQTLAGVNVRRRRSRGTAACPIGHIIRWLLCWIEFLEHSSKWRFWRNQAPYFFIREAFIPMLVPCGTPRSFRVDGDKASRSVRYLPRKSCQELFVVCQGLESIDGRPVARVGHSLISHSAFTLLTTICRPPPIRFIPGSSTWPAAKPSKTVSPGGTRT